MFCGENLEDPALPSVLKGSGPERKQSRMGGIVLSARKLIAEYKILMSERIETQISGKYSQEESRLFDFKKLMENAKVHVNYPAGEEIIEGNFAITSENERGQSYDKTELSFLRSVKDTPVHIVYNLFKENEGYIGESASIEVAYALAHNKPLVLLRDPVFAESVPDEIKEIITQKTDKINVANLDQFKPEELEKFINELSDKKVDYELSDDQKTKCMHYIRHLLKEKRRAWKSKNPGNAE